MTVVISLVVVAVFGLMLRNLFDKKARIRRVAKNGVEAKAVLLHINYDSDNTKLRPVRLQIQVYPETGRNFVTEISQIQDYAEIRKYRVGDYLTVRYNPFNTKEILIVSPGEDDL